MKYRRLAAAASFAVLLSLNTLGNAHAETRVTDLNSTTCVPDGNGATADGNVPPRAWHLDRLDMQAAWGLATGANIKVAVIDTGVAATGTPFFAGNDKVETLDVLDGMNEDDMKAGGVDCTHGTAVASLIAAARPDGRDVDVRTDFAGIAPDATIISYRVLRVSERQEGQENTPLGPTIAAVRDATARGVNIINLSQSVDGSDPLLRSYRDAVADALKAGIVVVAAAGNYPDVMAPSYPGAFEGVISVGSSTRTDAASARSLANTGAVIGAPGEDLMALRPSKSRENAIYKNQSYADGIDGTSFAAPIVSGVVALMLEADSTMTPDEVRRRLMETADPPPAAVPDSRIGYGIVNPMRALTGVARPQEGNPGADTDVLVDYLPTSREPDMVPALIAVSVGAGAVVLAAVGLVMAISLPAATRRNKS
ncbi:MAG: S8 family serine peptidase [Propionibacteriaceae bacterium]|nr:S8 family serine peptidase [Propionibacteriaceae bacterium]